MSTNHKILLNISECLASMACGMQNAMTTTFSGAIIRTTHMTGVLTDLGIQIGRWLKKEQTEVWKIKFFASLTISFVVGSIIGLALFSYVKINAMWVSVLICLIAAQCYYVWRRVTKQESIET